MKPRQTRNQRRRDQIHGGFKVSCASAEATTDSTGNISTRPCQIQTVSWSRPKPRRDPTQSLSLAFMSHECCYWVITAPNTARYRALPSKQTFVCHVQLTPRHPLRASSATHRCRGQAAPRNIVFAPRVQSIVGAGKLCRTAFSPRLKRVPFVLPVSASALKTS